MFHYMWRQYSILDYEFLREPTVFCKCVESTITIHIVMVSLKPIADTEAIASEKPPLVFTMKIRNPESSSRFIVHITKSEFTIVISIEEKNGVEAVGSYLL